MRFHLLVPVILLTLLSAAESSAEDVSSCAVESGGPADLSWLEDLTGAIQAVPNPDPVEDLDIATKIPELDSGTENAPEESAMTRHDLHEPLLGRLRREVRKAAAKCRTRRWRRICGPSNSKYLCYRAVKEALRDSGLVRGYLPGDGANDAHNAGILARNGFKNIMAEGYTSRNAPLGAVLVYEGGSKRCRNNGRRASCGHIEVKLNSDQYCSDFCKSTPVDSYMPYRKSPRGGFSGRKLLGVYVKE